MAKTNFTVRQITVIGFFSALSYVLMLLHLPFKYLGFLELEFSDIPAIIATLAYGPVHGVLIELIKNLIKALTASSTGCVGELSNFVVSACYVIPLGLIYKKAKFKHKTITAFIAANVGFIISGILINYFVTVPLYATLFGGMDAIIGLTSQTVSAISSLRDVVILGITPFNFVKGVIISVVGLYCYKILKGVIVDL